VLSDSLLDSLLIDLESSRHQLLKSDAREGLQWPTDQRFRRVVKEGITLERATPSPTDLA